uniref:DUF1995 domain-containing protein n=1 Tax=Gossypium raimondii TaxID=29730 RepID=A0A0D2QZQ1_GOSRA|nr:hypothetical protein B456_004G179700 [Gossypium raimondii]
MLLSNPAFAVSSTPHRMVFQSRSHWTEAEANANAVIKGKIGLHQIVGSRRNLKFISRSVSEGEALTEYDTPFPNDYIDLLKQAKRATELALKDGKQLMEIEFPTAGLGSVPGDGEGGNEMTGSMQLIREFCDILVAPEKVTRTRIFFPEANEVKFARQVFEGASFKLDYLTKPSFFEDFGFGEKVKMADRVKPGDELFLVGYPYFNVNEMIVVEELYKEAVMNTNRKMIIFNGELDRIRSGCILSLATHP